jgi:hypothetical protein
MRNLILAALIASGAIIPPAAVAPAVESDSSGAIGELIPWLLKQDGELRAIPFRDVILHATGRRVLAFNPDDENDQRAVKHISGALDRVVAQLNAPDSVIQSVGRINEVSTHFENAMRQALTAPGEYRCEVPRSADGQLMRSGYPDMRLTAEKMGRVYYLDAKLYAAGSRGSSFRTFYFEPKVATNKVRDDAVHFIAGFEHEARKTGEGWKFTRWDLIDLSQFKVKLKAEFQASNRDMYRPEAVVATSVARQYERGEAESNNIDELP